MVNHKEILRLKSLGLTHREIVDAAGCGRNTVTRTLARAREQKLDWQQAQSIAVFKIKAHIRKNETTLSSQKAKHSERRVGAHSEEHPEALP